MKLRFLIVLMLVLFVLNANAQDGTVVVTKDLNADSFKGNANIIGDVNLSHDFNYAFRLFQTRESFTPEPDKIYITQHRMVSYRNDSLRSEEHTSELQSPLHLLFPPLL